MFRLTALLLTATACLAATPTIFVVGDSTANNTDHRGWGDPVASYFDASKVNVLNRARGGRSSRTFVNEGLWDKVMAELKPGDYVLLQFGHNDGGAPDKPKFRASLPGLGEETQEVTVADGSKETVHTFGFYMRKMTNEARSKGATVILLSPTVRNIWKDGKVESALGQYGEWTAAIGKQTNSPFFDLSPVIASQYQEMGESQVKLLFPEDHTHTSPAGADLNAKLVVAGLKGMKNSPFIALLSDKGRAVEPYPPVTSTNGAPMKMPVPANPALPTLFLIGDSTVRNGRGDGAGGQWGWGEPLVDLFDTSKINVVNRAVGGLSSRTYLIQGHWDRVKAMIKPGDFVMMQFGHNDNGPLDDAARARGTLKGSGEETKEIDNPITKQHETVHTYGWYLRKFIAETKAAGATPVMCTLIPRKTWKDGKIAREQYAVWAREVAAAEHVAVIDLNELISKKYEELGPEKVEPMFGDPHTHTSRAGAELNASIIAAAIKDQHLPLAAFLAGAKSARDWNTHPAILQVDGAEDIYAIGDVHGDVERMLALLKAAKLSDDGISWTGGKAVLVYLGDMIDKGPRMVDTLRTIRGLQLAAPAQGGRVIAVLGNHEAEFLTDSGPKKFDDFRAELKKAGTSAKEVAACQGDLGTFLCSLPAGARVNDWFFSHGGNTNGHTLAQLDGQIRAGIQKDGWGTQMLADPNSLLEARLGENGPGGKPWIDMGLPKIHEKDLLAGFAKAMGVNHFVMGHQPNTVVFEDNIARQPGEAFQRWGLLFLMDTGLSRGVDNSKGAMLHIHQSANTAEVLCATGKQTLLWDTTSHAGTGRAICK